MNEQLIKNIESARVYDVAIESPLDYAKVVSARLGNKIFLKREDQQSVFSFKLRGAYNKIAHLTEEERNQGVIAASAGNHAQGVALAANKLGIPATIVMPTTTPSIKVESVTRLGGKAVLFGDTYDEAYQYSLQLAEQQNLSYVHPYDDEDVIAGQGTVAMEILKQHPEPIDAIFIAIGGGGLVAGMAAYIKYYRPEIKIIGVEPQDAPTMHAALKANKRVDLGQVGIFADGVAVRKIGEKTFEIAKDLIDEVLLVSTDEICAGIKDIFDETRSLVEPAGALSLAGIKQYIARGNAHGEKIAKQTLIGINCGANVNFDRLRHIAERAELGERRECLFAVTIPEQPGSFLKFCRILGSRGITEFNYRYADNRAAHIFVGVRVENADQEKQQLLQTMNSDGYSALDISENEMAILHLRHMVGGHCSEIKDEILFRFEFPERPGALLKFLETISHDWNISLFHYRNHGAAYGRVLVGIQVPVSQRTRFDEFLEKLGYRYWEESTNPVYKLFLA
ncbi:MAG: threonine ammonia-lyase, biosynthetic [Gammaproteobacteria bacterium]|nr:MAG: threonine ammonia-lyase, biosynthetic [Gammaproteobacteria bacterium]